MRQSQNWNGSRSAFESDAAYGWPAWREMRPLLLRSAGVVGLAGMVIAVISNDALMGTGDARAPAPAVWQEPSEPELPVAAVIDPAELRASGEPVAYADGAGIEPAAPAPAMQIAPLVFSAEPIVGRLERTVFVPPAPAEHLRRLDDAPQQTASIAPRATPVERVADALATVEAMGAGVQADAASLWAQAAVECPRDWLADQAGASEHCDTIVALLPSAASPDVQAALHEAAEEHALALGSLGPRMPRARPEPPPNAIKKVSTRRRASDWPATPPPDCGTLHAYWRFVDRKTGAKEWYCK